MSTGSAALASIHGHWDVFDRCAALLYAQIKRLSELDEEDSDSMVEYSMSEGQLDASDGSEELIEKLREALTTLDDVRLLVQQVEAAIPD